MGQWSKWTNVLKWSIKQLNRSYYCPHQRFQPQQIICICADICTFPDLHYRHEQTSAPFDKLPIWSKERGAERTFPLLGGHFVDIFCKKVLFWQEKASVMWWFRAFVATWALSHLRAFLVWFWCRLLCRHWGFCADIVQISAQKNARWKLCLLVGKVTKKVCSRCGSVALNMPLGPPYQEKKKKFIGT